jgi:hypothetical protein
MKVEEVEEERLESQKRHIYCLVPKAISFGTKQILSSAFLPTLYRYTLLSSTLTVPSLDKTSSQLIVETPSCTTAAACIGLKDAEDFRREASTGLHLVRWPPRGEFILTNFGHSFY